MAGTAQILSLYRAWGTEPCIEEASSFKYSDAGSLMAPAIREQLGKSGPSQILRPTLINTLQTACPKGVSHRTVPSPLMDKCKNIPVTAKAVQLPGDTTINIPTLCSDLKTTNYWTHMGNTATYAHTRKDKSEMRPSSNRTRVPGTCTCITLPVPEMHGLG